MSNNKRFGRSLSTTSSTSDTSSSSISSSCDSQEPNAYANSKFPRFSPVPAPVYPPKVERAIYNAKKKHRSDIDPNDWNREGFAGSDVCDLPLDESNPIKREHCSELSVKRFIEEYELPVIPVIIDGVPEVEGWGAIKRWSLKKLRKKYKRVELKCGEDDYGKSVRIKFKYFFSYLTSQTDDSPLYIFDSSFDDHVDTKPLLDDYQVPKYFPEDLFSLVGEDRRPPYRWFLVGPKRSGTTLHVDPLGTSAWNTLIIGRKRWVLFPPHLPKHLVNGKVHLRGNEDDEAVNYFMDLLPRLKRANSLDALQCIEFMQYPGETVFIPGGWWHAVLNVDDTVAVTQNFCSSQNFAAVWRKTRSGRKRMAVKWLKKLEISNPELAALAKKLNEKDNYIMYSKERIYTQSLKNSHERKKKRFECNCELPASSRDSHNTKKKKRCC
ncbi:histone arginine [Plasmopara halstedii]|uniref:Histone arginine n=1 Tax=Plasmopara halstedii TaxID=4781 RepID=A0A0P1AHP6_PLAHL|nr:histone arginine [Plasmopara halstedii]CEG39994.1 histone arginine [Plasmopara halstedii]|eukprot:XP_024576363.1 histone arginine [Plasmopara halstedii]